ncbi:MAG: hypothetical protein ACK2U3_00515 [Anaerolineales bacterium]|jgi:hypothetical protein
MTREERGNWYLITGVVVGLAIGLLYAWLINPVDYVDTAPNTLKPFYKDQYRVMIAAAYDANPDIVRAKARLELLGDEDAYRAVAEQAQHTLSEGGTPEESQVLGKLAAALGKELPISVKTPTEED